MKRQERRESLKMLKIWLFMPLDESELRGERSRRTSFKIPFISRTVVVVVGKNFSFFLFLLSGCLCGGETAFVVP